MGTIAIMVLDAAVMRGQAFLFLPMFGFSSPERIEQ